MGNRKKPSKFAASSFDADACMARRIKHHESHISEHTGGHDQAVAIAAHECGISRGSAEDHSKLGCYSSQVARFDADGKSIKINGAAYEAVDTGDGYHTVKSVPIIAEIVKGTHGAPYDVTKDELDEFLSTMQSRYSKGKYTGALSVGHNDDFGLTHPAFAGYFLPVKVAKYTFPDGKDKWALFADLKLTNEKFALFASGKLPYHSPEIYPRSWDDHKIDIVSFLDTKPPYFEFAINTVGNIQKNDAAKFEAKYEGKDMTLEEFKAKLLKEGPKAVFGDSVKEIAAKFEYEAASGKDGKQTPTSDGDEAQEHEQFAKKYPHIYKKMKSDFEGMESIRKHLGVKFDSTSAKPDPMPIEPDDRSGETKMELDPKTAAKFALYETKQAELEAKMVARDNEDRAKAFVAKADTSLSKKVVPETMKNQIAKFAAQAVLDKDGEAKFTEFVEALKAGLRDKPPATMSEFSASLVPSLEPTDPILSKFATTGANMEDVAKFASQYRKIKESAGDSFECDEESFIKNEILQSKVSREKVNGTMRG